MLYLNPNSAGCRILSILFSMASFSIVLFLLLVTRSTTNFMASTISINFIAYLPLFSVYQFLAKPSPLRYGGQEKARSFVATGLPFVKAH
jgi:hypothetical protein